MRAGMARLVSRAWEALVAAGARTSTTPSTSLSNSLAALVQARPWPVCCVVTLLAAERQQTRIFPGVFSCRQTWYQQLLTPCLKLGRQAVVSSERELKHASTC